MARKVVLILAATFNSDISASYRNQGYDRNEARALVIPGDIMLGGLFPMHEQDVSKKDFPCGDLKEEKGIQRLEAMVWALDRINISPNLLPNITLGAMILDTCSNPSHALEQTMQFVRAHMGRSGTKNLTNDGKKEEKMCPKDKDLLLTQPVAGVIGASFSGVSIMVANILKLFQIPQISYASTSTDLSDKSRFEYFSRVVPPDNHQAQAMVELVRRLGWSYVSTVAAEGEYGEKGISSFIQLATKTGVCIATSLMISRSPDESEMDGHIQKLLAWRKSRAIVLFVDEDKTRMLLAASVRAGTVGHFLWIGSDSWGAKIHPVRHQEEAAEGAITILPKRRSIVEFDTYFRQLVPPLRREDCRSNKIRDKGDRKINCRNPWFREFWSKHHKCNYVGSGRICTGDERVRHQQEGLVPFVIDAVFAMAHSLHNLVIDKCCLGRLFQECVKQGLFTVCQEIQPIPDGKLLLASIRNVSFTSLQGEAGGDVRFNSEGDAVRRYDIYQYQRRKRAGQINATWNYVWLGEFGEVEDYSWNSESQLPPRLTKHLRQELYFEVSQAKWGVARKANGVPDSTCSKECPMGMIRNYESLCCWVCLECREDSIVAADETCRKCPHGYVANVFKDTCIKLQPMRMSWMNPWAFCPLLISAVGILLTTEVMAVFLAYSRTSVVMASGRELCIVLLLGILLSYSAPFILLARPSPGSCAVLRGGLGLSLSICYSAILTKTSRISRIFNHHGKHGLRWISPQSQLLICFGLILLQLVGVLAWLVVEPPDKQIIYIYPSGQPPHALETCSVSSFSIIMSLLYNMILIILCTVYAFKTRKIPENFNEAKYIGFTMYSTCIVWLAFIPIFFGTHHDYQVQLSSLCMCVTVSATVVLCLMFGPKMYLVMLHPEKCVRNYPGRKTRRFGTSRTGNISKLDAAFCSAGE